MGAFVFCTDFKVTINPQLCMQTFPLLMPDEISRCLVRYFSTYAFSQMVVSDNTPLFTLTAFQNFLSENTSYITRQVIIIPSGDQRPC